MKMNRTIHLSELKPIVVLSVALAMALLVYSLYTVLNASAESLSIVEKPSNVAAMPELPAAQFDNTLRWKAVATQYAPQSLLPRAQFDNTLRWKAVATQYAPKPLLNRVQAAEAARWNALAGNYAAQDR
jgi:hypothetical protein